MTNRKQLTWKQFVDIVNKALEDADIDDLPICYIDISYPFINTDTDELCYPDFEVYVSDGDLSVG